MKLQFSPLAFMILYCSLYAFVFAYNLPLFLYYPLHGDFSWGSTVTKNIGPAMAWYGLMVSAVIPALVLSILIPNQIVDRLLRNFLWVFPAAAMLTCLFLLRPFFMRYLVG